MLESNQPTRFRRPGTAFPRTGCSSIRGSGGSRTHSTRVNSPPLCHISFRPTSTPCWSRTSLPGFGDPGPRRRTVQSKGERTRTSAHSVPSRALYQTELHPYPVGKTGVEPAFSRFRRARPLHLAHFPKFRASGGVRTRASWLEAREAAADLTNASLLTVPAAGVEPAPPRFRHGASTVLASPGIVEPVPRQGIEPCISRLKAGGFAIGAREATLQFRGLESNQRPPPSKGGISASTESSGVNRVARAGIEPASSTFKGWHQLPALNPWQYDRAAVVGLEPTNCALTERRLTFRLHTAVITTAGRASHSETPGPQELNLLRCSVTRSECECDSTD